MQQVDHPADALLLGASLSGVEALGWSVWLGYGHGSGVTGGRSQVGARGDGAVEGEVRGTGRRGLAKNLYEAHRALG